MGRADEAVTVGERALRSCDPVVRKNRSLCYTAMTAVVTSRMRNGELAAAESMLQRLDRSRREFFPAEHNAHGSTRFYLGILDLHREQWREAELRFRQALEERETRYGTGHGGIASSLLYLGIVVGEQGRLEEAERHLRRARPFYEGNVRTGWRTGFLIHQLARVVARAGRIDEARELFEEAIEWRSEWLAEGHPYIEESREALAALDR